MTSLCLTIEASGGLQQSQACRAGPPPDEADQADEDFVGDASSADDLSEADDAREVDLEVKEALKASTVLPLSASDNTSGNYTTESDVDS